jgi:branched-chain amino acid transport system substrate-binding protein
MSANPDVVEMATVPPNDAVIITKQLMEAGYAGIIGSLGGTGSSPIVRGAGGVEKLKGFYWLELIPVDDPGVLRMKADYEKIMKGPPPENATFAIASTEAEQILRAISIAGTDQDGEKLAATLRSMTPESRYIGKGGWRGKTLYNGVNQELAFPVGLGLVVDGKLIGVQRVEIPSE